MGSTVVRIVQLGKQFRLGEGGGAFRYKSLRDSMTAVLLGRLPSLPNFRWALKDINLEIGQGEVVGLVGRNGAGKSTLLRILAGITEPTEGYAEVRGRIGSLLEVGTGFHPELTGRENIYLNGAILGMRRAEIRARFDEIVEFAEIEEFLDTPVKRYSSGMFMRLAFAVAAHLNPEILLVDEVLAVGDSRFQEKCLGKMSQVASEGRTVLFVSHNMAAVRHLCRRCVLLDAGEVRAEGPVDAVIREYLRETMSATRVFERGPLIQVSVSAGMGGLGFRAEYKFQRRVAMPSFGFVISDSSGAPLFGSNPLLDRVPPLATHTARGVVEVFVRSPSLRSGMYRVSVWMGDGREDFSSFTDCLVFEVVGGGTGREPAPSIVGAVVPSCVWCFETEAGRIVSGADVGPG